MSNKEKAIRLKSAIKETEELLSKATKKYNDTITCLKMEIEENKELGNDISANKCWIDYCNQDKARVNQLKSHLNKLNNMLKECL
jgi:FtsZ-binding cell division protein ZapB